MSRSRSTVRRPSTFAAQAVPGVVHDVLRSGGEPLSAPVRVHMESRFGRDFSQVRVHADERAAEASEAVDASAFTAGRSIVFGAGEYRPETGPGRMLLAHELAHVVQQGARTEAPTRVGASSDPAEREARGAAQGVALGGPVAVAPSSSPPILQRQELPSDSERRPFFLDLLNEFRTAAWARKLQPGNEAQQAPSLLQTSVLNQIVNPPGSIPLLKETLGLNLQRPSLVGQKYQDLRQVVLYLTDTLGLGGEVKANLAWIASDPFKINRVADQRAARGRTYLSAERAPLLLGRRAAGLDGREVQQPEQLPSLYQPRTYFQDILDKINNDLAVMRFMKSTDYVQGRLNEARERGKKAEPAPRGATEPAPPQDVKPVEPEQTDAEIDSTWYPKRQQ